MKKLLLILLCLPLIGFGQDSELDKLIFISGDTIYGNVTEVGVNKITYRHKGEATNNIVISIKVAKIIYSSGREQIFKGLKKLETQIKYSKESKEKIERSRIEKSKKKEETKQRLDKRRTEKKRKKEARRNQITEPFGNFFYVKSGVNISNANYDGSIEMTTVDNPDGNGVIINSSSMHSICFSISTYLYEKNRFSLGAKLGYANKGFSYGLTPSRDGYEYEYFGFASFLSVAPSFRYSFSSKPLGFFIFIDPQLDIRLKNSVKIKGDYPYETPSSVYDFGKLYSGIKTGFSITKKISDTFLIGLQSSYWHNLSGTLSWVGLNNPIPLEDPKSYSMDIMFTFGFLLDTKKENKTID